MPRHVVVLGGGVSGEAFIAALRRLDKEIRITLVENELVGGECSYWACIPSKTLLRPVEIAFRAKTAHGVEATLDPEQIFWWRDKNAEKEHGAESVAGRPPFQREHQHRLECDQAGGEHDTHPQRWGFGAQEPRHHAWPRLCGGLVRH